MHAATCARLDQVLNKTSLIIKRSNISVNCTLNSCLKRIRPSQCAQKKDIFEHLQHLLTIAL